MNTDRAEKILVRLKQNIGPAATDNTVVSASVIGYTYNYVHGESWFDGKLHYEDNTTEPVKFKKFSSDENEVAEAALMFRRSLTLNEVQGVAKVRFLTKCEVKNIILVCYDPWENLTTWLQKSSSPTLFGSPLDDDEDILHTFWAESIRSMLLTIQNIHSHGLYHGGLSMDAAYGVSPSSQLKILGVAKSLEGLDSNVALSQKLADLTGFRVWLSNLLLTPKRKPTIDLRCFLDFFDLHDKYPLNLTYTQLVKRLTKHPFLLSPTLRVGYCDEVHKAYDNRTMENVSIFGLFMSKASNQSQTWKVRFKKFQGWRARISCHSLFEKVDEFAPNSYCYKLTDLLRFLRNMNVHYISQDASNIDRCMRRTLCPGFLSYLHEHQMPKDDRT